jgi:hypothetical protein
MNELWILFMKCLIYEVFMNILGFTEFMNLHMQNFMNIHHYCSIRNCPIIMNLEIYECSSFLRHHECPIISSLHLHEIFMIFLWINYESYSWNIHEHTRIHGFHEHRDSWMFIISAISWMSNNKFMNSLWMNYESYSWSIHEYSRIHGIHEPTYVELHEHSSLLQRHEVSNNKFIAQ